MTSRILVVDDDPAMVQLLKKHLTDAGYIVLTAGNGREALSVLRQEAPHLVIADYKMPEMDGIAFTRAARMDEGIGLVYIIMLTAHADPENIAAAFEAGVDDFLTKPFHRVELLARLQGGARLLQVEADLARERRLVYKVNAELAALNSKLERLATTDELTGLYNRREAMRRLEEHWSNSLRHHLPLSCQLLDIDHFKRCNDTYGHEAGDVVLREVARVLMQSARSGETVFRLGGEEFLLICPGSTAEMAAVGAERIRLAVERHAIPYADQSIRVTISIGVAQRDASTSSASELLQRADAALYHAKQSGRNRFAIAGVDTPDEPEAETAELAENLEIGRGRDDWSVSVPVVLLVDDDPDCRRLCARFLEKSHYRILEAENTSAAIRQAELQSPDVIVLDAGMAGADGIQCARQLKASAPTRDIPIIMLSAKDEIGDVLNALEAGAEEYVTKPVDPRELLLRVKNMVRMSRAIKCLRSNNLELASSYTHRGEQALAISTLFDLTRKLSTCDTRDEVLEHTVIAARQLLACRRLAILTPDDERHVLTVAHAVDIEPGAAERLRVPAGALLGGRVFADAEPRVLDPQTEAETFAQTREAHILGRVPLAAVPLRTQHGVLGVLLAADRIDDRPFVREELEYVELVCNAAATALHHLSLRESGEDIYRAVIVGLARLAEHRDPKPRRHLERVTSFALAVARELRMESQYASVITRRFLDDLRYAVPLHDIGKIAVPDEVLFKTDPLQPEETELLNRHTEFGAQALTAMMRGGMETISFLRMAREVARHHHERYDGTGFPDGLAGTDIPLSARIAAVADVYDNLTSLGPEADRLEHAAAIKIIRDASGTRFDPGIVEAFLRCERRIAELARRMSDDAASSGQDLAAIPALVET